MLKSTFLWSPLGSVLQDVATSGPDQRLTQSIPHELHLPPWRPDSWRLTWSKLHTTLLLLSGWVCLRLWAPKCQAETWSGWKCAECRSGSKQKGARGHWMPNWVGRTTGLAFSPQDQRQHQRPEAKPCSSSTPTVCVLLTSTRVRSEAHKGSYNLFDS